MSEGMTIRDIAGFCPKDAIWKMLADVGEYLLREGIGYQLNVDTIVVDREQFIVVGERNNAPKEDMVWNLGAIAYFMATGHEVFGGHGYGYQQEHPQVALPMVQKSLQDLTPVIHGCLCYDLSSRIEMNQICKMAQDGMAACKQQHRIEMECGKTSIAKTDCQVEKWPEEMKA